MHYHTVLFQFAPGTSEDVVADNLEHLRAGGRPVRVRDLAVGPTRFPVVDGWTHGMAMVFDTFDAMMADYAEHPLHVEVQHRQVPQWSRYMAMDVSSDSTVVTASSFPGH